MSVRPFVDVGVGYELHAYVRDVDTLSWVADSGIPSVAALTGAAPAAASVGVASGQAVAANSTRRGLVLVNTSANTISLAFGANAAVLNSGITLDPGAAWTMDTLTFTTAAVNAIASAAASNLAIQEFTA